MSRTADSLLERAVLATLVAGLSGVVSVANLAGSMRVLDLTSSTLLLSISVLLYNIAFTAMSWAWPLLFLGRLSRRGMMVVSASGIAAGLALMGLSPVPALVILGSGITGLFFALMSPVMITVLTDYFGKDSIAVTKFNTYSSTGFVMGYVIAIFARYAAPTSVLLTAVAAASAGLAALALAMPQRYVAIEPRRPAYVPLIPQLTGKLRPFPLALPLPQVLQNLSKVPAGLVRLIKGVVGRKLPTTYLGTAILFTAISLFFTPMPAFLRFVGLSDVEVYAAYLIASLTSTVTYRLIHPVISDYRKAWNLLLAGTATRTAIFLLPTYVLALRAPPEPSVLAGFVAVGLTWAAISSSLTAVVLAMSEKERKDERLGQLNAMIGVGTIAGSLIAGPLTQYYGYIASSLAASALAATAALTYFIAKRAIAT